MDELPIHLAMHGVAVLTVSVVAGVVLWRVLYKERDGADWHLVHASGSVRGVFLLGLAAIIHLPALPEWLVVAAAWQIIFFSWASLLAMIIRAFTGERGFYSGGSKANRIVHVLYWLGALALLPACVTLVFGLWRAL